ncbi:MAG: hypothetical protein QOI98_3207, partial [Solirubrobacteraceae bacterium]|nr:hypothetical protein [Solirubrobacteraceae bacterium]
MALDWVQDACTLLIMPAPTLADLAAWLGVMPPDGDERLFVERPAAVDAQHVLVLASDGRPTSLTAGYAAGTGPTAVEAEHALGRARELPRPVDGPFQLAFAVRSSEAASCFVAATTHDPPGTPAEERRLVEIIL